MSAFTCDHGESYALFGSGGGAALAAAIGSPLLGQIPLEPSVAAGNDAGAPVAIEGTGAAADMFRSIAQRIITDIAPPSEPDDIDMAGCSARLFDCVNAAFVPRSDQSDRGPRRRCGSYSVSSACLSQNSIPHSPSFHGCRRHSQRVS